MPTLPRHFFPSLRRMPPFWLAAAAISIGLAGLPGGAAENAATALPETAAPKSPDRPAKPSKRKAKPGDEMKSQTASARDLMPVKMLDAAKHEPITIVRDGVAKAIVCVAEPQPSPALQKLLAELVESVRLTTGATLPVVAQPPGASQAAIVVGDCPASRAAGIKADEIPIEGFVVKTVANRVYLVGSTQPLPPGSNKWDFWANDGTAWAVADFLERFVGVRWYWPLEVGGRSVEEHKTLVVPPTHYADAPAFRMRTHHPRDKYTAPWQSTWFEPGGGQPPFPLPAGTKDLSMQPLLTCLREGSSWPYTVKCHEPQRLWKIEGGKWATSHKELFEVKGDGKSNYSMLCYSSPATLKFLLAGCEAKWDGAKNGVYPAWVTETSCTVSPGDAAVTCFCEGCRAKLGAAGDVRGRASVLIVDFVTRLAKEVERRWPDKKVTFLPYWNYAHCPPDIKLPDNVEVMFANNNAQGMPAMREAGLRVRADSQIRAWSAAVGGPISTWEYSLCTVGWTHGPVQWPHIVQDHYKRLRGQMVGSFINGGLVCEWSKAAPSMYVWMRVLWNPDIDVEATLSELCRRQFGAAGKTSSELLFLMCEGWEKSIGRGRLGEAGQMSHDVFFDAWPPPVIAKMVELRKKAQRELKDDPEALARLDYWLWTFDAFVKEAEGRAKKKAGVIK